MAGSSPGDWLKWDFQLWKSNHVEVAWGLLEEIADEGNLKDNEIVEQYPNYDGTVVERTLLA